MQLYCTGNSYCDLVVWTPASVYMERITPDADFITSKIPMAHEFVVRCVMPELLGRWYTRPTAKKGKENVASASTVSNVTSVSGTSAAVVGAQQTVIQPRVVVPGSACRSVMFVKNASPVATEQPRTQVAHSVSVQSGMAVVTAEPGVSQTAPSCRPIVTIVRAPAAGQPRVPVVMVHPRAAASAAAQPNASLPTSVRRPVVTVLRQPGATRLPRVPMFL